MYNTYTDILILTYIFAKMTKTFLPNIFLTCLWAVYRYFIFLTDFSK